MKREHTLVKKSLQPAAKASCLSLCKLDAVSATMITGDLNNTLLGNRSSPSATTSSPPLPFGALLLALLLKTPILFNRSSLLISLVASNPLIIGNWISINTRWNPPARHFVTASLPFIAVCQRTFRRFMNASRSFRFMMLSSTIRTFMGGTPPLSIPAGRDGWSLFAFLYFLGREVTGRGEETRGGGVMVRWIWRGIGSEGSCCGGAGGVGRGGAVGGAWATLCSDVLE